MDVRGLALARGVHRDGRVPRRRLQPRAVRRGLPFDLWFALAWGAFPAATAFFAQTGTLGVEAVLVATACAAISAAQRVLSTPVRWLRRSVTGVTGVVELADGSTEQLDARSLRRAPEGALRWLSAAMPILAGALLVSRLA